MPTEIFARRRWQLLLLLAILILAAFLRLYHLDQTPPGFHYDEAFNAMQARDVLRDVNRPIFFTGNFGEEPMQMYVEAILFALGGVSPYVARLSNVVLGLVLIPALFFCGRALFPQARVAPPVAALVGAILYWAVNFSRLGIETGSLPWVLTLSAGALALAQARNERRWAIAGGLLLGASVYTYLASRVWPFAVFLWLAYLVLLHRPQVKVRTWLTITLVAGLTIAPLALFFLLNPLALTGRAGQVLTLDRLGGNLLRTAGMFLGSGDMDPRDNLPGRAALDPFLGLLFIVGLLVSLRRARQPGYAFLLIWLVVMTLPSALTEFAPNFRRAIGGMPAVALLCGVGTEWISQRSSIIRERFANGRRLSTFAISSLVPLVLLLGFGYSTWAGANAYFVTWARDPGLFYSFDAGLQALSRALAARPPNEQLCLSPDYHEHPTVLLNLDGRPFSTFDGRRVTVLPDSALATTCAIITFEDQVTDLTRIYPNTERQVIYDLENKPYATLVHIPAGTIPSLEPQHALDARIGPDVRVLGYDLSRTQDRLDLRLYWRATGTMQADYTAFVHLIGPVNPETGSPVWSNDDARPGHGSYPTNRWRNGETIIDMYTLRIPANAPEGKFQIEAGLYLLATGERLPVMVGAQSIPEARLLFAAIDK